LNAQAKEKHSSDWVIRPTTIQDRGVVARLLSGAPNRHLHLDWFTTYELLDESPSLIAFEDTQAVALLACPPDPEGVGWIRYFAVAEDLNIRAIWDQLWRQVLELAPDAQLRTIAALVAQDWIQPLLLETGFVQVTRVIFYEWQVRDLLVDLPQEATLRTMSRSDIQQVAEVDERAFRPLWQHSSRALAAAFDLSSLATVIEIDKQVIGYQISTSSALGAHLARLAIDPEYQGQGLAKALVIHALRHYQRRGIERMSVNTQADNERSQLLYEKLGFKPTGQAFPVLVYDF
jgi:ribosomal protein S18 acetylase RimI-like enzyme